MLKAMRKQYKKIEYDTEKEIIGAEQVEMRTQQYQKVVKQQKKIEQDRLDGIKRHVLANGKGVVYDKEE